MHFIVPLPDTVREHLAEHLPDEDELVMLGERFGRLQLPEAERNREKLSEWRRGLRPEERATAKKPDLDLESTELRDAAFHLLWFAREFALGRHPLTADQCNPGTNVRP